MSSGGVVLDLGVNIHGNLDVIMAGQVLHGFGINSGVDQVGDIGMTQLVRRCPEVHAVDHIGIMGSPFSQLGSYGVYLPHQFRIRNY